MVVEQRGIICRLAGGRRRVKPSPALALAGLATTAFSNVLPFLRALSCRPFTSSGAIG